MDFSKYRIGDKLHLVNLAEHVDGRGPARDVSLAEALAGTSLDPCVGRFLEFRVVRNPAEAGLEPRAGDADPEPRI